MHLPRLPTAAASALILLSTLIATQARPLLRADTATSTAAATFTLTHAWWRTTMTAITHTADPGRLQLLLAVALTALAVTRHWRLALFTLSTAVLGVGARITLLHLIARPRPPVRLVETSGWSYPSGHTTSSALAAAVAVTLACALLRPGARRRTAIGLAVTWAALVGVSRVALAAHWPTDVLAGWMLAVTVATALHALLYRRQGFAFSAACRAWD